ncbi:MAG: hypothetical protein HFJ58_04810 [Clostridia bacterium]|nr:hypothetical protein [Clostridia bacterium]
MVNVTVINIRSIFKLFIISIVLIFVLGIIKFVGGKINLTGSGINVSFVRCINDTLPKIKEAEYARGN